MHLPIVVQRVRDAIIPLPEKLDNIILKAIIVYSRKNIIFEVFTSYLEEVVTTSHITLRILNMTFCLITFKHNSYSSLFQGR